MPSHTLALRPLLPKVRFYNDPLLAYLGERMMRGAVVAMDDAWQAEPLPLSQGHFGQVMLVHELVQGGEFEPLAVPPVDHGRYGLGFAPHNARRRPSWAAHAPPRATLELLEQLAAGAPSPFASRKIAVVRRSRARMRPPDAPGTDAVRVSLVDGSGDEAAVLWAPLPPAQPPPQPSASRAPAAGSATLGWRSAAQPRRSKHSDCDSTRTLASRRRCEAAIAAQGAARTS